MNILSEIREKNPVIKRLVEFQKSIYYPILFGIICVVSSLSTVELYIPLIWLLAAGVIFSALFTDDLKVFFVPFLMIYYAIGMDNEESFVLTNGDVFARFDTRGLVHFAICGTVLFAFFLWKFISLGAVKKIIEKRGSFFAGIICLDVAFLLNGAFSATWVPINIFYGFLNAAVLTAVYFIFLGIFRTSKNAIPYLCKTMICFGFMVLLQIFIECIKLYEVDKFFYRDALGAIIGVARHNIILSWGISTIIGAAIVTVIPAVFYFARNAKFGILFYIMGFAFWAMTFVTNTRSAMLCGFVVLFACIFICCKSGVNKKNSRVFMAVISCFAFICGGALIALIDVSALIEEFVSFFRLDAGSSGRVGLWKNGLIDFVNFPIFGSGFDHGGTAGGIVYSNVYSNMYHNIIIEMLGSMGLVGIVAFLIHIYEIIRTFLCRISGNKSLLLLTPILILAMSLFDNFFFYPNFQIIYAAFLAAGEGYREDSNKIGIY